MPVLGNVVFRNSGIQMPAHIVVTDYDLQNSGLSKPPKLSDLAAVLNAVARWGVRRVLGGELHVTRDPVKAAYRVWPSFDSATWTGRA